MIKTVEYPIFASSNLPILVKPAEITNESAKINANIISIEIDNNRSLITCQIDSFSVFLNSTRKIRSRAS